MEKLTFKRQIVFVSVLIIAANIFVFMLNNAIFSSIAWIIYGLLFFINPVCPEQYRYNENKIKIGIRIAGIVCIIIGLITRFIV